MKANSKANPSKQLGGFYYENKTGITRLFWIEIKNVKCDYSDINNRVGIEVYI